MTRSIASAMTTALADPSITLVWMFEADFNNGTIRWVTGPYDVVFDGDTFSAAGDLLKFSPMDETSTLEAKGLQVTLTGAPASLLAIALDEVRLNKEVKVYLGLLDSSAELIEDPILRFQGYTDAVNISDDIENPTIALNVENKLIRLDKPNMRRYTDQDQKDLFAGDKGLEYVAGLQDKVLQWGSGVADKYKKDN